MKKKEKCFCSFVAPYVCYVCEDKMKVNPTEWLDVIIKGDKMVQINGSGGIRAKKKKV